MYELSAKNDRLTLNSRRGVSSDRATCIRSLGSWYGKRQFRGRKAEKKLCEEGECKHEKGEKSIFTRIADKKQQAGERTRIPGHTQIKGKGDER